MILEFVSILGIFVAILNIILFFKVWGMTNNVMRLTMIAQKFTNIEYLLDEKEFVKHDENKKLKKKKEDLWDANIDHTERIKLIKEIDKKIIDTYF